MTDKKNHAIRELVATRPPLHNTVPTRWSTPSSRQTRAALTAMVCAVAIGACTSDNDETSTGIAQLSPATPGTLTNDCEELLTNFP